MPILLLVTLCYSIYSKFQPIMLNMFQNKDIDCAQHIILMIDFIQVCINKSLHIIDNL